MQCRKVLLIMAKYASAMPERGLSPIHDIIGESLKKTGLVQSVDTFYSDEISRQVGADLMGDVLLSGCAINRPDLVVFWPVGWLNIDPQRSLIYTIINTLGIKVYMVRGDSVGPDGDIFNMGWFPFISFIGFWDATVAHLGYSQNPKAIQGFTTYNPDHFYDRKLERDIDVSFIGSLDRHHRAEYIHFLQEHGVNVVTGGGHGGESVSFEEYATIMSRSKISLNFCCQNEGYSQIKGRVFHATASKSLLIEDEGIETSQFFNEGRDFIMCKSKEDMLERVKYYLEHDEERETIAQSGYSKTTSLYNPRNMWAYTLSKMGFEIPDDLAQDKHYQELYHKLDSFKVTGVNMKRELSTRDCNALEQLVRRGIKPHMMIAEVGSWTGTSASILAKIATEFQGKVFAIDHWLGSPTTPCEEQAKLEDVYSIFKENMIALGVWDVVYPLVMDSETASQIFADGILDLVFIDADHRYDWVKYDIVAWLPKLKDSGILCGHDCDGFYSQYSEELRSIIDQSKDIQYINLPRQPGQGIHPGVIKALYDCFQDKYSRMPNSAIWYIAKDTLKLEV